MRDVLGSLFGLGIVVLFAVAVCWIWFCEGHESGEKEVRQKAVDAGVAEWTVDSKGEKGFRFLTPETAHD